MVAIRRSALPVRLRDASCHSANRSRSRRVQTPPPLRSAKGSRPAQERQDPVPSYRDGVLAEREGLPDGHRR
jgi:hypothetical protein